MQHSVFLVGDTPYCAWGWDLRKTNLEFLNHIDPAYFDYQAKAHLDNIEGEHKLQAAIALRTSYHHGLETFFALVCAALQAPDCVVGWFEKYQVKQIRHLVSRISSGGEPTPNKLILKKVTWETFSSKVNRFSYADQDKLKETHQLFARLWRHLAHEFLEEVNSKEYNHIKHGARAKSGGCLLRVGKEHEEGISPPDEEMATVGGSQFGTSFFMAERVQDAPLVKPDPHFRLKQRTVNWDPESLAHALCLVALSIQNILSYLKIVNGVDPREVKFTRPAENDYFEQPWKRSVGVTSVSMDFYPVHERHITRYSIEQLMERFRGKTS